MQLKFWIELRQLDVIIYLNQSPSKVEIGVEEHTGW